MKAYRIRYPDRNCLATVDLGTRYHLPKIHCDACGSTWGETSVDYPAFQFEFLNEVEFNSQRVVSLREFCDIRDKILRAAQTDWLIRPGGAIGQLFGETSRKNLDDFIWGRIAGPQISRRAQDILAAEGINLMTAEISLSFRGNPVHTHLAIQPKLAELLTEITLKRQKIDHCPACGDFNVIYPRPGAPEDFEIISSAWPKGEHLVKSVEIGHVFASGAFVDCVRKHNLTGITFVECGSCI